MNQEAEIQTLKTKVVGLEKQIQFLAAQINEIAAKAGTQAKQLPKLP
jgi:peptidoglycan hydrolase CwlO-like protein